VLAAPIANLAKDDPTLTCSKPVVSYDDLSDQGRWGLLTGLRYLPSPSFATGRCTGGPTWAEHLASLSGVMLAGQGNGPPT
jgi:hypothetical protein